MNDGNDRFNLRLPWKADRSPPTSNRDRLQSRPPQRPFSARAPSPFVTHERRPVSNSVIETKTFDDLNELFRTSSSDKNEMHSEVAQRGLTSARIINRPVLSRTEAPHHEAMSVDVGSNVERDAERIVDSARGKRMSDREMQVFGSKATSMPRSTPNPADDDDHDETGVQPVQRDHNYTENLNSDSFSDSGATDESYSDEGRYTAKTMNLYESLAPIMRSLHHITWPVKHLREFECGTETTSRSRIGLGRMVRSTPHHGTSRRCLALDLAVNHFTDLSLQKRKLSKTRSKAAKQRDEIERAREANSSMKKRYDESRDECKKLLSQRAELEGIVREEG
ncbi:hypothetical protein FGB62_40g149 [Gracilaria domingensis]|nr:hypothetical protein FGB62_40g149 [Gracilaria domingensis]